MSTSCHLVGTRRQPVGISLNPMSAAASSPQATDKNPLATSVVTRSAGLPAVASAVASADAATNACEPATVNASERATVTADDHTGRLDASGSACEWERVVVVGNGMVGQRFVDELLAKDVGDRFQITVIGEENRLAYDRVALSSWFEGRTEHELSLVAPGVAEHPRVDYITGTLVAEIDPAAHKIITHTGNVLAYDHLVIATGSYPFVPPLEGRDLHGCFVYRTIDDLEAIKAWSQNSNAQRGLVIGGGLLGLEAANALLALGLQVDVVELAAHAMPQQLTAGGGNMLSKWMDELGVALHCGVKPVRLTGDDTGVAALQLDGQDPLPCDIVIFSAGVRPRDELAELTGLARGSRGGITVDSSLKTSLEDIYAIGEVACHNDRCYGLVAPGYDMARALADRLCGGDSTFDGADMSTKLKLLGVDVASFGNAKAEGEAIEFRDPAAKVYRRLVIDADTGRLLGGELIGDVSGYELLVAITLGDAAQPDALAPYVLPSSVRPPEQGMLPGTARLCSCNGVTVDTIRQCVGAGAGTIGDVKAQTQAGTSCGGCVPALSALINDELRNLGVEVSPAICEHFDLSRQQLFDLIRFHQYSTWAEVRTAHGRGLGCEICRPTVASILASLSNGYVLDGDQASLQDTNDHHLANLQRNGTYSVVPRVPGGEITPDQLIALGQIANEFSLYTKITGGQRIDLFGAKVTDLPAIWERVIAAGMESGHAYGKALRTVKSCVGSTWCRYGVLDSVGMAITVEERYRGLRSPHKIKMAVSGCTRECAEAQSKDVGVIATETGWALYVGGNGGRQPRHADLVATDLSDEELLTAIDRFVMFYIRTADRLQRTSVWVESLDGGLEYLRQVIFDDSLGICDELDRQMQRHVDTYECEWKATLASPERLANFVEFVNAPDQTTEPEWRIVRGQRVPV